MRRGSFITRCRALTLCLIAALAGLPSELAAAELEVISAGAVRGVLRGMIDDYARRTGQTFKFTIGSTGELRQIIASGAPADLVIASAPLMAELEKTGRMTPGSRVDIGRIGLGVVVGRDAPSPDVATPDGVRRALLGARSIAYTDPKLGGTSYLHLLKIADGFGIAQDVTAKGVHATGGDDAVAKVAAGQAELAVVLISEIHDPGARLVAPLPEQLQLWTVYASAIPASSKSPAQVRDFVSALTGPAMRDRWLAAGWQPAK